MVLITVVFIHCLPSQPICYLSTSITSYYYFYMFSIWSFLLTFFILASPLCALGWWRNITCCKVWLPHFFWYLCFIYINLSTAAQKWQGWYQWLLRNGRVESLFFISACFVCYPGLQDICLLTQVWYIVRVMSTSQFNLANFYFNFLLNLSTT